MRINLSDILHRVINENVNPDDIVSVINNKNYVDLNYVDENGSAVGTRLVQPYVYGRNHAGNPVIRVLQVSGDSLRKREWKTLRTDRIVSWKPRKQTFSVPPELQGINVPPYREDGDDGMSVIMAQVSFGDNDTLSLVRNQTRHISNAPKIAKKNKIGPVPYASQQRKQNIFTSQPNSEKYRMYQKNFQDTENEIDRFNDEMWAKAEQERNLQNNNLLQNTVPNPPKRDDGPVVSDDEMEKEND